MAWGVQRGGRRSESSRLVGGPPLKRPQAVSKVACSQGVEGSGMAGPINTSGNPWPHLAIRPKSSTFRLSPHRLRMIFSSCKTVFLALFCVQLQFCLLLLQLHFCHVSSLSAASHVSGSPADVSGSPAAESSVLGSPSAKGHLAKGHLAKGHLAKGHVAKSHESGSKRSRWIPGSGG
jgi:hypothetical protein